MKYRRKNAEVEAMQFTATAGLYVKTVAHNAADVAEFAGVTNPKDVRVQIVPVPNVFGETYTLDMRTSDGLVMMLPGDWLVRVGGRLEKFTAAAFAETYEAVEAPDFVERMKVEKAELDARLDKLAMFVKTEKFQELPQSDRWLLLEQQKAMANYAALLTVRIALTAAGEGKAPSSGSFPGKSGSSPDAATNVFICGDTVGL